MESDECKTAYTQTYEFHEVVIDLASAALHDEDIFSTNRLSNLDSGLADGKLGELGQGQLRALLTAGGVLLPAASLEGCRGGRKFVLQGVRKAEETTRVRELYV